MTVSLSPAFRPQFFLDDGTVAAGAQVFFYTAGTSNKENTYSDSAGAVANPNPIVLNSAARPDDGLGTEISIFLTDGVTYDVVIAPSTDSDPPVSAYRTISNITGDSFASEDKVNVAISGANSTDTNQGNVNENLIPGILTNYAGNGDGTTDDRTVLSNADTDGAFRLEKGNYRVASNLTISNDIYFQPGAILEPDAAVTITITGSIFAGRYQIFGDSGEVSFSGGNVTEVMPEWWGAIADNSTDNATALIRMRDALLNDATILYVINCAQGVYLYSNNRWLHNVKKFWLKGNGTEIQNTNNASYERDARALHIRRPFENYGDVAYPGDGSVTWEMGYLINSASAGAASITCTTATDANNFSAGDRALLGGYRQQYSASYPPLYRWFEFLEVSSSDGGTGVVTFTHEIGNKYNSSWYDYDDGGGQTYSTFGAPRLMNLDRSDYIFPEFAKFSNMIFGDNAAYTTSNENVTVPGENVIFENCTFNSNHFVPQCNKKISVVDSDIKYTELDKIVDFCYIENTNIGDDLADNGLVSAVGVNQLRLIGGKIKGKFGVSPRHFDMEGTILECQGLNQTNAQIQTYQRTFPISSWRFANCTFRPSQGESHMMEDPAPTQSQLALTVASNTGRVMEFTKNATTRTALQALDIGAVMAQDDGTNVGEVTDIYDDGTTISVTGTWTTNPAAAEVYYFPLIKEIIDGGGNHAENVTQLGTLYNAFPHYLTASSRSGAQSYTITNKDFDLSTGNYQPGCRGIVTKIQVYVMEADTSADATCQLQFKQQPGFANMATINLKTAGIRWVDPFNANGAVAGDTLTVGNLGLYCHQLYVNTYDGSTNGINGAAQELPRFIATVEIIPFPVHDA